MKSGFYRLVFPYALFCLAAVIAARVPESARWLSTLPGAVPYAIWITGALLAWRFNRSRVVFVMLVLALAAGSLGQWTDVGAPAAVRGRLIYGAVVLLLPLNLLGFTLAKERGVLTGRGIGRLMLIIGQVLAVGLALHAGGKSIIAYVEYPIFQWSQLSQLPLPQPALMAFVGAAVMLAVRAVRRQNAMESGLLWALLTVFAGLCRPQAKPMITLFLATAGLILLVAVVESSYAMAFRDELTGLPARRALNETLQQLGSHYTLAMIDIDFFKKFNDRYGHDVGDQVLRKVAATLARVEGGGKAFRYGGEEFTIVFPGMDRDQALDHLERLRAAVAASAFALRGRMRPARKPESSNKTGKPGKKANVTVSIGVAERSEQLDNPYQVIKAADRALYRAKKAGRNRVAV